MAEVDWSKLQKSRCASATSCCRPAEAVLERILSAVVQGLVTPP
jgi:hypothetical protein